MLRQPLDRATAMKYDSVIMNTAHLRKVNSRKRAKPSATQSGNGQTRREQVASKEEAIIAAAHALFASQGFAKTTISQIAKSASLAEGTLYLYFSNKEALARGVLAAFYERLTQTAQDGVKRCVSVQDRLTFLARHHLDSISSERRILELISTTDRSPEAYQGSDIYQMNKDYVAIFDQVVREGVLRGELNDRLTLWVVRDMFFGGLEYAMRTILIKRRAKDRDRAVNDMVDMIMTTYGAASASSPQNENGLEAVAARLEAAAEKFEKMTKPNTRTKRRTS